MAITRLLPGYFFFIRIKAVSIKVALEVVTWQIFLGILPYLLTMSCHQRECLLSQLYMEANWYLFSFHALLSLLLIELKKVAAFDDLYKKKKSHNIAFQKPMNSMLPLM